MSQTRGSSCLRYMVVMIGVLCLTGMLSAQNTYNSDTPYEVGIYNISNPTPDGTLHIVNPGDTVTSLNYDGLPENGNLCAMVYVYNTDEQVEECCGCLLTPDSERTLDFNTDLLGNVLNSGLYTTHGVVKIISASPQVLSGVQFCDPTGDGGPTNQGPYTPINELSAWVTHTLANKTATGVSIYPEVEDRLQYATLSTFEQEFDQKNCSEAVSGGSGTGVCGCGYGD